MTEHDLSALDGLLDELDIEEKGDHDPRAAKIKALFEKARAEYTAKIDTPTWYISPSANTTAPFDIDSFVVPRPSQLLTERKASRTASTNQEWTANYLYSQGHFETCLSYVASFAVSVGIDFPIDSKNGLGQRTINEHDSSQLVLRRSSQERELTKNWGTIKDVIDAGIRSLLTILRYATAKPSIDAWVPQTSNMETSTCHWGKISLHALANGFLTFCMREIRIGAVDSRAGYSGMIIRSENGDLKPAVDVEKLRIQNWTVTHGLALTAGDLALELGLHRTAIEAHTLFLAARGQMWRVLLALANELASYHDSLAKHNRASTKARESLKVVASAAIVAAIQAAPRPRRIEVAESIITHLRVVPAQWISETLDEQHDVSPPFDDEDDLLFNGLLQPLDLQADDSRSILPEEIGIALVKVVFAKKSGILAIYTKFATYMREYTQRLQTHTSAEDAAGGGWQGDLDAVEDDDVAENGPRSVRTL
ncbi:amino acid transporter [Pseudozyma hubeiensis SY62]|uniref:Amino acid transporter n=1 Tax=Pseudozyma hubeiensis (strain SY62) TaxID=1305764 RepID=R9PDV1_PSEHS|nr:amino acid transporter [Pseudozyma hubeiensis SY62]GAC96265.1 amino acid transporter [Pseudozyma hubeiensis SY62]